MTELSSHEASLHPKGRKPARIDPSWINLQADGACWKEWMVRLPHGVTFQDMNEPSIWANAQSTPRVALRKFDRVFLVAFDESWAAEGMVSEASGVGVTLSALKRIDMPGRTQALPETEANRLVRVGNGYTIERKADGQRIGPAMGSLLQAERKLFSLVPRPVE